MKVVKIYCRANSNSPQSSTLANGCLYTRTLVYMYISTAISTHLHTRDAVYVTYISLNSLYIHDKCNFGDVLFHFRNVAVSCDGLLNVRYRMRQIWAVHSAVKSVSFFIRSHVNYCAGCFYNAVISNFIFSSIFNYD